MKTFFLATLIAIPSFAQTSNTQVNVRSWGMYNQGTVPNSLTNAVSITGFVHCYAKKKDGSVVGWAGGQTPSQLHGIVGMASGWATPFGDDYFLTDDGNLTSLYWDGSLSTNFLNVVCFAAGHHNFVALTKNGVFISPTISPLPQLTNVVSLATGNSFIIALFDNGSVAGWGTFAPAVPAEATNVVAISGCESHVLALRRDGSVLAWGDNSSGQTDVPTDATNIVAVAAGGAHSLALRANGTLVAWGSNFYGECNIPLDLPPVVAIAAGSGFSMAIVMTPPVILRNPLSQTATIGSTVNLSVSLANIQPLYFPLYFQWYFNSTNAIPWGTNAILNIVDASATNSGIYSVVVSNNVGVAVSLPATLNVMPGLEINMIPAIRLGGEVGMTYSLQFVNAIGQTTNWMNLTTVTFTNNSHFFPDYSAIGQPKRFYRLIQEQVP